MIGTRWLNIWSTIVANVSTDAVVVEGAVVVPAPPSEPSPPQAAKARTITAAESLFIRYFPCQGRPLSACWLGIGPRVGRLLAVCWLGRFNLALFDLRAALRQLAGVTTFPLVRGRFPDLEPGTGIEPMTCCLQDSCSTN